MYNEYHSFGLQIVAFPSNQFMNQEPSSNEEIEDYARNTMRVMFPIM